MKFGTTGARCRVESFHTERTYSGWLEGIPTKEDNDRIIARLVEAAENQAGGPFGDSGEKVYKVRATVAVVESGRRERLLCGLYPSNWLPEYYVIAVLDGEATDTKFFGAMAAVVFFVDKLDVIESIIETACADLTWSACAYDYDL